jgi:hypothetical protein
MYLPYLRGKQYELIALREYINKNFNNNKILPIVEPVKPNLAQLTKTLDAFEEKENKIYLIINPLVGNFDTDLNKIQQSLIDLFPKYNYVKPALIISSESLKSLLLGIIKNHDDICIIHYDSIADKSLYPILKQSEPIKYHIFKAGNRSYRYKVSENNKCVLLTDCFPYELKNADYPEDNPFSDEIFFFLKENRQGFSDYSIIRGTYSDQGGPAYTVAIHLVYEADEELRVRHFKSTIDHDNQTNIGGKFYEALQKMMKWISTNKESVFHSNGVNEFNDLFNEKHYPGLGYLKKISIIHHLELCNNILSRI